MAGELAQRIPEELANFRSRYLGNLRPLSEFAQINHVSRPRDFNEASSRIAHNTRHFSGNYGLAVVGICVFALATSPLLLIAIAFLVGGYVAINRFIDPANTEGPLTQKNGYAALIVIGLPLMWIAAPFSVLFWIVGASAVVVLGHASIMEPSVESEYGSVTDTV